MRSPARVRFRPWRGRTVEPSLRREKHGNLATGLTCPTSQSAGTAAVRFESRPTPSEAPGRVPARGNDRGIAEQVPTCEAARPFERYPPVRGGPARQKRRSPAGTRVVRSVGTCKLRGDAVVSPGAPVPRGTPRRTRPRPIVSEGERHFRERWSRRSDGQFDLGSRATVAPSRFASAAPHALNERLGKWRIAAPIEIASALPSEDLGYPCTLSRRDGTLVTVFYARDREGVTFLRARIWRLS